MSLPLFNDQVHHENLMKNGDFVGFESMIHDEDDDDAMRFNLWCQYIQIQKKFVMMKWNEKKVNVKMSLLMKWFLFFEFFFCSFFTEKKTKQTNKIESKIGREQKKNRTKVKWRTTLKIIIFFLISRYNRCLSSSLLLLNNIFFLFVDWLID